MSEPGDISIKEYLRLTRRLQKNPLIIEVYDDFILKTWALFDLRSRAEDSFTKNRNVAYSPRKALPLGWLDIRSCLESSDPPADIITQIAKKRYADIDHLLSNLRKVLRRVRQKEALGRVQQIDAHCLRWLTRQPGRSPREKAGSRQEILAVTRVEYYNTLENRVLKDFMVRASASAIMYLRKYAEQYDGHKTIREVRRFSNLCREGLTLPLMNGVGSLEGMPQPNYVLQQDSRYSKVWKDYCRMIRQEEVVAKLWEKREECLSAYENCVNGVGLHNSSRARYHAPIWFNDLDGRHQILDSPWWKNELAGCDIVEPTPPREAVTVVDLTSPWDNRNELVYGLHDNSKPYIQNPHRPNPEPFKEKLSLRDIVREGRLHGNIKYISDYFEQLYGLLGGEEWVVLVPDDWEPEWIEHVKRACPLPRHKVFFLWRSIAAVLGHGAKRKNLAENGSIVVIDGATVPEFIATKIVFKKSDKSVRVLPQRASFQLHKEDRFISGAFSYRGLDLYNLCAEASDVLCIGLLNKENFPLNCEACYASPNILRKGVERFLSEKRSGQISYYDELDAFTLIRTTASEQIEKKELVVHDECWPGGTAFKTEQSVFAGNIAAGESKMSLYMYLGVPDNTSRLKLYEQEFDQKMVATQEIRFDAEMTPGQGMAIITLHAAFLDDDIELALHDKSKMLDSDMTVLRIERELKRHFPPNMPFVEACDDIWRAIVPELKAYVEGGRLTDNGMFAKAQNFFGEVDPLARDSSGMRRYGKTRIFDPNTMSPVDRLKRENVFGNSIGNRVPHGVKPGFFTKFFPWLAEKYKQDHRVLRLIAWTYQYDNKAYEPIRKSLFKSYTVDGNALDAVKTTFCSNNFKDGDVRISQMLTVALNHIASGNHSENELRLVYNLLQFHPTAVEGCSSELCARAFYSLVKGYNDYNFYVPSHYWFSSWQWNGQPATKMAGYYIKCMLFLLHRRRFDDQFLKAPKGWRKVKEKGAAGIVSARFIPPGLLGEPLPTESRHSDVLGGDVEAYGNLGTLLGHEAMRRSFIEYVNGRGTLEGIPNS